MAKPIAPNAARGERSLTIGGEAIVICASMDGLARLSTELGFPPLAEMLRRLTGGEINAVRSAVEHLAVSGDGVAARAAATVKDLLEATPVITQVLMEHIEGDHPGNGEAGAETA